MYNIAKDSLFQPRALIKYRNKSAWFAFFYLFILTLFMTIGGIVFYAGYQGNSEITSETTGCEIVSGSVVCDGSQHVNTDMYHLYGYQLFFLDASGSVNDVTSQMGDVAIVIQGGNMMFYISGKHFSTLNAISQLPDSATFDGYFASVGTMIMVGSIILNFLGNLLLLVFISLVSTIPFVRLRHYIRYGTIYKLVVFAITPIAILMTFYNLLNLPEFVFFLLMLVGYRSIFLLQRELYYQTMLHLQEQQGGGTVNAEYTVKDEEPEATDDDDSAPEDSDSDEDD